MLKIINIKFILRIYYQSIIFKLLGLITILYYTEMVLQKRSSLWIEINQRLSTSWNESYEMKEYLKLITLTTPSYKFKFS